MPDQATQTTVIIGNGIAGTTAAFALRDAGYAGSIILIAGENSPVYFRTRLPEMVSGSITLEKLIVSDAAKHAAKKIDLRLGVTVLSGDAEKRTVSLSTGETLAWDDLVVATGCRPLRPPLPGMENLKNAFSLRTFQDADAIREFTRGKRHGVCVGGGVLGLEAAFNLARLGVSVEVVEMHPRLMSRQLDKRAAAILQRILEVRGCSFVLGSKPMRFVEDQGRPALQPADGQILHGDLFVPPTAVEPRRELTDTLGLACKRGIVVDADGRTSQPHIWAAGDTVQYQERTWGTWMAARSWGQRVGQAIVGNALEPLPISEPYRLKITGTELLSVGETDLEGALTAAGSHQAVILVDEASTGRYQKIVISQGFVAGAIVVGSCPKNRVIEKAVADRRPWKDLETELTAAEGAGAHSAS